MGFRKLEYVAFLICEGKRLEISIAGKLWHTDWTWSDALWYCQIVLLHKRNNTKARCPTVLQEGLCFLPIGARFRAQVLRWPGALEWWLDPGGTRQGSDVDYLTSSSRFGVNRPIKCHAVVTEIFYVAIGEWILDGEDCLVWFRYVWKIYLCFTTIYIESYDYIIYVYYIYIYVYLCVCWNLSCQTLYITI